MKAIVLAGGFATRLWPITESRAKPLLLVNGRTILEHLLQPVLDSGLFTPADIYLCTNQKFANDFRAELATLGHQNIHIFCEDAHQEGEKLGALGAISAVIKAYDLDDDLLILAGDNILTEFDPVEMQVEANTAKITVRSVPDLYAAQKFGVIELTQDGVVSGFEEKPAKPKSTLVSAGFLSLGKDLLPTLHAFAQKEPDALGGIFPEFLEKGIRVTPYETRGEWFDVGSFETYLEAHKTLQAKDLVIDSTTTEKENTYGGKVFIGGNCQIENSTIIDSVVYPGVTLKNCQLANCVIDTNCHLENLDLSYKIIRQNTTLVG